MALLCVLNRDAWVPLIRARGTEWQGTTALRCEEHATHYQHVRATPSLISTRARE